MPPKQLCFNKIFIFLIDFAGKQLGCGAFGVVMKAEAQGICESDSVTTVAVKMVRRSTESTYIRALASELKIMVHLGKHLNVVNLLGACTKNIAKSLLNFDGFKITVLYLKEFMSSI